MYVRTYVCPRFCLVLSWVGRGLEMGRFSVQGVLQRVLEVHKLLLLLNTPDSLIHET